jgi:hypothetical protein
MTPDVGRQYLLAARRLFENLPETQLILLVEHGDLNGINLLILNDRDFARAFLPYTQAVRRGTERAAIAYTRDIPTPPGAPRTISVGFDMLNPNIVQSVRTMETRSLATIQEEIRGTIRQHIEAGIRDGVNPRVTARELRDVIGLAPNQEAAIQNFRKALETGDFTKALGYQLRDGRHDALLKRLRAQDGTLTAEQIERFTNEYRKNWRAWNAETHARTAALDANRLGQRLSWQQAIDSGALGDRRVFKKWVTAGDERVRPEHEAMNGVEIPFDQAWPVDGGVQVPGENAWNCRCIAMYRVELRTAPGTPAGGGRTQPRALVGAAG